MNIKHRLSYRYSYIYCSLRILFIFFCLDFKSVGRIPNSRHAFLFYFFLQIPCSFLIAIYFVLFDHSIVDEYFNFVFIYILLFESILFYMPKTQQNSTILILFFLFDVSILLRIQILRDDFYVNLSPLLDIIINRIEAIMIWKNAVPRQEFFSVFFFVNNLHSSIGTHKKSISRYTALFPI